MHARKLHYQTESFQRLREDLPKLSTDLISAIQLPNQAFRDIHSDAQRHQLACFNDPHVDGLIYYRFLREFDSIHESKMKKIQ